MTLEAVGGRSSRRPGNRVGEATRLRLLKVSLELFNQQGIDEVSIRDISARAKVSSAAINYHFGSKGGLVEELLRIQAAAVTARREERLDELEGRDDVSLRDIAEVFVLPMLDAEETIGEPGTDAVFLAAAGGHPEYADLLSELYEPGNRRLLAQLTEATPHLSHDIRMIRWAVAKDIVNHAAANPYSPFNRLLRYIGIDPEVSLADALIDVITAAFGAPSNG